MGKVPCPDVPPAKHLGISTEILTGPGTAILTIDKMCLLVMFLYP